MHPTGKYIEDCLNRRLVFFTGKGGVGKSTFAWATALACHRRGRKVAVASWTTPEGSSRNSMQPTPEIPWVPLETLAAFREYTLQMVKFEKIYDVVFDNPVLRTFVLAAPGLSDTVTAGKIWELWNRRQFDLILVDLPASGHAVSFFRSPLGVQRVFSVGVVHRNLSRICEMFSDPRTRLDIVTLPEELPLVESRELKEKLEGLHAFRFGFLHVNRWTPEMPLPEDSLREQIPREARACWEHHEELRRREASAEALALQLDLPVTRFPRLPTEHRSSTVERIARHMEAL